MISKKPVYPLGYTVVVLIIFIFILGSLPSCQYEDILPPEEEPIDTTAPPVSFSEEIIPMFTVSCAISGCHNLGGVSPDLSAQNAFAELDTKGFLDRENPTESELYQWMIGNRSLPMPISGPDSELNRLVLTWIAQGALDN